MTEDKLLDFASKRAALLNLSSAWGTDEDGVLLIQLITRIEQLTAEVERLRVALTRLYPSNLAKVPDHLADDFVFPLDVTAGELRAASHALGDKQ